MNAAAATGVAYVTTQWSAMQWITWVATGLYQVYVISTSR